MYNIRNTSGRILAIMLEKGGFSMRPNAHLDLDKFCSRKWINSNADLRKLRIQGHVQLVHDSYAPVLPKAPIKNIQRPVHVSATPKKAIVQQPVQIVDLESTPDVEIDDDKQVVLPVVEAVKTEVKTEEKPIHPLAVSLKDLVGPSLPLPAADIEAAEERIEAVLPVLPDPEPKEVAADPIAASREFSAAPAEPESKPDLDISAGFDASRLPRMKQRRRFDQKGKR